MLKNNIIKLIPANENLAEQVLDYYLRNKNFFKNFEPKREDRFFTLEFQKELLKKEVKAWKDKKIISLLYKRFKRYKFEYKWCIGRSYSYGKL